MNVLKIKTVLPLLLIFTILFCGVASATDLKDESMQVTAVQMPFIENQCQTNSSFNYYANTYYGTAYITTQGLTHDIKLNETDNVAIQEQFKDKDGNTLKINPQGEDKSQTQVSVLHGSDSSQWQTNLPTYNQVLLGEIYPNIQVKVQSYGGNVEKLFFLQPGSDVNDIVIKVLGANNLKILDDGSLAIETDAGIILMSTPIAYQDNQKITVSYKLLENNNYGFSVGEYDLQKTLVIDPTLLYSSYLGGNGYDYGNALAVDSSGNIYITGQTSSTNFPTTTGVYQTTNNGGYDLYVAKINPSTGLIYSTYIGGNSNDIAYDIVVDSANYTYITGQTSSDNFPVTTDACQLTRTGNSDVFVVKLNPTGTGLAYSTYLGGGDFDAGRGIALDNNGNIYITGLTGSNNFPVSSTPYQKDFAGGVECRDCFVAEINTNTGLVYSSYLGGSGNDYGSGITVDNTGNIYIIGTTSSTDFPTSGPITSNHGNNDAFIVNLNPSKGLEYSIYIGGNGDDYGNDIARDNEGNIYITGQTQSSNFTTTTGAYQTQNNGDIDVFITKLNSSADLVYSTYLGGNSYDYGISIALDSAGNAYITGLTSSDNFPLTSDACQNTNFGEDAFMFELNSTGTGLIYSTYLGGRGSDIGKSIDLDSTGNIYIVGQTLSENFPTTTDAYQTTYNSNSDAFLVKFAAIYGPDLTINNLNITNNSGNNYTITAKIKNIGYAGAESFIVFLQDNSDIIGKNEINSLASNTSITLSWNWTPTTQGLHTLTVVADGQSEVTETDETNNQASEYINVTSLAPDLTVLSLQTPSNPYIGNIYPIIATIKNIGTSSTGKFKVILYDRANNPSNILAETTIYSLGIGESKDLTLNWTAISNSTDLEVFIDSDYEVKESDENNNTIHQVVSVSQGTVDLKVVMETLTNLYSGNSYPIKAIISNIGTGGAGSFQVNLSINGVPYGQKTVTYLNGGTSTELTWDWIPNRTGTYILSITANINQTVRESGVGSLLNNFAIQTILVNQGSWPDLTIDNVQTPSEFIINNTYIISADIKNIGTGAVPSFRVGLYDGTRLVDEKTVNNLNGESYINLTFSWTPTIKGQRTLTIMVDKNYQIRESNENNNRYIQQVTVLGNDPDLMVSYMQTLTNAVAGASYSISSTISNVGIGTASTFKVTFYDNGNFVQEQTVPLLESGASTNLTWNWTPTTGGNHNLTITVDSANQITENNENNNSINKTVSVVIPDLTASNMQIPVIANMGTTYTISASINNSGTGNAEQFKVALYDNGTIIEEKTVNSLSCGSSTTLTWNWTPTTMGRHNISIKVDNINQISESNEYNNSQTQFGFVLSPLLER